MATKRIILCEFSNAALRYWMDYDDVTHVSIAFGQDNLLPVREVKPTLTVKNGAAVVFAGAVDVGTTSQKGALAGIQLIESKEDGNSTWMPPFSIEMMS